jgi:hypothetical protein
MILTCVKITGLFKWPVMQLGGPLSLSQQKLVLESILSRRYARKIQRFAILNSMTQLLLPTICLKDTELDHIDICVNRGKAPRFLNLDTKWNWGASLAIMVLKLTIVVGWKLGPPAGNRNSGRPISSQSKNFFLLFIFQYVFLISSNKYKTSCGCCRL